VVIGLDDLATLHGYNHLNGFGLRKRMKIGKALTILEMKKLQKVGAWYWKGTVL
jgi:hypothetical protein